MDRSVQPKAPPRLIAVGMSLSIALFAAVPPAGASIPPSYRILVISGDTEALARSEALVQYMSASQAFFRAAPSVRASDLRPCLEADDFSACAGPLVPPQPHWQEPAHVVIKAERVGPDGLRWVCAGPSRKGRGPTEGQTTRIDARAALFGEGEPRTSQLSAAMRCIQDAASTQP